MDEAVSHFLLAVREDLTVVSIPMASESFQSLQLYLPFDLELLFLAENVADRTAGGPPHQTVHCCVSSLMMMKGSEVMKEKS